MEKCYVLNYRHTEAYEIKEETYKKLWDVMENDSAMGKVIHIVKGEDTLERLFPEARKNN